MSAHQTFLNQAIAKLGPRAITQDPDLMEPWLTDWRGAFTGKALAMAAPRSTEQVADLVKLCNAFQIPIVPQGGNSGMVGGATPDSSGHSILLSLRQMNTIEKIDISSKQVTCEAGVILQTLHDAVREKGLRFPLSLGGKGSATIGGMISTNAGGTQVLRHGCMGTLTVGLEAVLADGRILSALTPLKKDNRGFDLKQLFTGSEGTLGIITRATLKLIPAIAERTVIWAGIRSLQEARALLQFCEHHFGNQLEGFEVLPQACLDAVLSYLPDMHAPLTSVYPWHALIEVVADHTNAATLKERTEAVFSAALRQGLMQDAVIAANETQADRFWTIRESISPAERARGPAVQHDISVPAQHMPEFVDFISRLVLQEWSDCEVVAFGHLGDGNVHLHVIAPQGTKGQEWRNTTGKQISHLIYEHVSKWHGSISAEHGIGQLKREEFQRFGNPVALDLQRRVKAALDPAGILNPGKLI